VGGVGATGMHTQGAAAGPPRAAVEGVGIAAVPAPATSAARVSQQWGRRTAADTPYNRQPPPKNGKDAAASEESATAPPSAEQKGAVGTRGGGAQGLSGAGVEAVVDANMRDDDNAAHADLLSLSPKLIKTRSGRQILIKYDGSYCLVGEATVQHDMYNRKSVKRTMPVCSGPLQGRPNHHPAGTLTVSRTGR